MRHTATASGTVRFPIPWLVHPTDSAQNIALPLTPRDLVINHPQTIADYETLGASRKTRSQGPVLGAEGELIIMANHQDPRTYNLAERLRAAKALATTWLLKLPQDPSPLMTGIPGNVLEVSLGAMREVRRPGLTVITIPFVEVGEAVG